MNCDDARELILENGPEAGKALRHAATCDSCREFAVFHQSLDQQLSAAFAAPPPPSPALRAGIRARVAAEKRRRWEASLPGLVAPVAGLLTSGVCALLVPEVTTFFLSTGISLSLAGYAAHLLFVWLTEELGEG
jgi:hypothetical protein